MDGRRPTISSMNGIVAAAHPLAAAAGAEILAKGGNAFDAAVATASALNVVEPYMSSLAGMGLATCWIARERRVRTLNFVPRIPLAFPAHRFSRRAELARGAISVGTPGNLAGWTELLARHGTMDLAAVFAPAIRLAETGFPVLEFNVEEHNQMEPEIRAIPELWQPWARNYTDGSGRIERGFVLRQPDLARTLAKIARDGAGDFYGRLVRHLSASGGFVTEVDITDFRPSWSDPAKAVYRGCVVNVPPPPCEGFQFLIALAILDGFDLASLPRNGVEHLDKVWRAIRLSAGERIANNNPTPDRLDEILGFRNIKRLRERLGDGRPIAGPTEQWMAPAPDTEAEHHTTSFSVADADGNLVCITQSIGSPYGSAVIVPETGVMLNNFLFWTDVQPDSPNRSRPGRRAADVRIAKHHAPGRMPRSRPRHAGQLRHQADPDSSDGTDLRLWPLPFRMRSRSRAPAYGMAARSMPRANSRPRCWPSCRDADTMSRSGPHGRCVSAACMRLRSINPRVRAPAAAIRVVTATSCLPENSGAGQNVTADVAERRKWR